VAIRSADVAHLPEIYLHLLARRRVVDALAPAELVPGMTTQRRLGDIDAIASEQPAHQTSFSGLSCSSHVWIRCRCWSSTRLGSVRLWPRLNVLRDP
jgi:hypothetical protein